jgi:hypothetical protein
MRMLDFFSLFFKFEISFKKLELCENMLKLSSKHYHRVIFISSYFELTHNNRLRDLLFQMNYICALNILFKEQIELSNDVYLTVDKVN